MAGGDGPQCCAESTQVEDWGSGSYCTPRSILHAAGCGMEEIELLMSAA